MAEQSLGQLRLAVAEAVLLVENDARFEGHSTTIRCPPQKLSLVDAFHGSIIPRIFRHPSL